MFGKSLDRLSATFNVILMQSAFSGLMKMRGSKRFRVPFFFLALSLIASTGLSDGAAEESRVQFVAQGLPNPGATSINAMAQRGVLRTFLRKNPGYLIKPFNMPQIGVEAAMDSGTLMAISAGMGPNAIHVNFRRSATYNEQGFLLPMEILLARVLSENPLVREVDENGEWKADPTETEIATALQKIRERVPEPFLKPDGREVDGAVAIRSDGLIFVESKKSGDGFKLELNDRLSKVGKPKLGKSVTLGVRPEDISDSLHVSEPDEKRCIEALIEVSEPMGSETFVYMATEANSFIAKVQSQEHYEIGRRMKLQVDLTKAHLFENETQDVLNPNLITL